MGYSFRLAASHRQNSTYHGLCCTSGTRLLNKTRQYNINKVNKIIIFYQAALAIKLSNLLICFCSFDLSCSILVKLYSGNALSDIRLYSSTKHNEQSTQSFKHWLMMLMFTKNKEMFYLTMHSTHFIFLLCKDHLGSRGDETHCHHYMGYSFRLAARDLLYAPSHRQYRT